HWGTGETWDSCSYGLNKNGYEFSLLQRTKGDDQHTPSGFGNPYQFTQSPLQVGEQRDAVLRSGDVEGTVLELEGLSVHNTRLQVGQSLLVGPRLEPINEDRRNVGSQYLGAKARRRDTQGTAAGGHVQKLHARTQVCIVECSFCQGGSKGSDELVKTVRDAVPCLFDLLVAFLRHRPHLCMVCNRPARASYLYRTSPRTI